MSGVEGFEHYGQLVFTPTDVSGGSLPRGLQSRVARALVEGWESRVGGGGFSGEVGADFFCGGGVDDGGEGVGGSLLDAADGAEVLEEALAGAGAYAGDAVEF